MARGLLCLFLPRSAGLPCSEGIFLFHWLSLFEDPSSRIPSLFLLLLLDVSPLFCPTTSSSCVFDRDDIDEAEVLVVRMEIAMRLAAVTSDDHDKDGYDDYGVNDD